MHIQYRDQTSMISCLYWHCGVKPIREWSLFITFINSCFVTKISGILILSAHWKSVSLRRIDEACEPPGSPSECACVLCLDGCCLFRVSGIAARVCSTLALVVHAPLSVINMKTTAGRATIVTSYLRWCQHYSSVVVLVSVSVTAVLSVSGCVNETSDWLCLMEGYGPVSRLRCHISHGSVRYQPVSLRQAFFFAEHKTKKSNKSVDSLQSTQYLASREIWGLLCT